MRSLPRLAALCVCVCLAGPARAETDSPQELLNRALRPLEGLSRTGVIVDRVLPLAHLEAFDGSPAAPVGRLSTWWQGLDELQRASLVPWPAADRRSIETSARASLQRGVIPLAVIDRAFERIPPEAWRDGTARIEGDRLITAPGFALERSRAVLATALAPHTYRGRDLTFVLDRERWLSDDAATPRGLALDFDDGLGLRPIAFGQPVHVHYGSTGTRTLRLTITRGDGSVAEARFAFLVAALATPTPDDTLHVTAKDPWKGQYATGDAYVDLAPGHVAITNPAVVIEGFDLDNSMNWDELYALLNQENLLESLRADGYDAIVLNFTDATLPVEENGLLVAELIREVQDAISPDQTIALVGASMGGLCSRYALAFLEGQSYHHRVRNWISFDAPHLGADIPLGVQYWIQFFAPLSTDAQAFLDILNRPAAREMLIYHLTNPPGTTGQRDPMRDSLLASFAAVGGWPHFTRRVAVSNGSAMKTNQGFLPGDQVLRWEYSSLGVSITGNVWALPSAVSDTIFRGSRRILFSTTSQTVIVNGTTPWDGAPGGSRATFAEMDSLSAPYGDIQALHPSHDFIPSISSLALPTSDPFYDIAGTPNLVTLTPFDAVYVPTTSPNQEHVMVTPENAVWIRNEIERVDAAVPGTTSAAALRWSVGPNPFADATRIELSLPRVARVTLSVYDLHGRRVRSLLDGPRAAGTGILTWDGRDDRGARLSSGVFFLRLESGGQRLVRRIVRLG